MPVPRLLFPLVAVMAVSAAQLPELRTEAASGGSVFYVKNISPQPLTAYLIELLDYPGSSYWLFQDDLADPVPPGSEKRIPVSNMTVGAAPEYVKLTAALYADGSSAGTAEKVALILGRRKSTLETARELIRRIDKARQSGTGKAAVLADLKQWTDSLQTQGRANRMTPANVNQAAARSVVSRAIEYLDQHSIDETLENLRWTERVIAAALPPI